MKSVSFKNLVLFIKAMLCERLGVLGGEHRELSRFLHVLGHTNSELLEKLLIPRWKSVRDSHHHFQKCKEKEGYCGKDLQKRKVLILFNIDVTCYTEA